MKDFENLPIGNVYGAISSGTSKKGQQGTVTKEEAKQRAEDMRTQGRKGCKAIRINMAFTPSNHDFIRVMAKATGHTMTQFANLIIEAYRNEHPEFMEQANSFLSVVNARTWGNKTNEETEAEDTPNDETRDEQHDTES